MPSENYIYYSSKGFIQLLWESPDTLPPKVFKHCRLWDGVDPHTNQVGWLPAAASRHLVAAPWHYHPFQTTTNQVKSSITMVNMCVGYLQMQTHCMIL